MPRIEQMPDGTYVKRTSPFESDLIERLYQEVRERKAGQEFLEVQLDETQVSLAKAHDEIEALKTQIRIIKTEVGMPLT